MGFTATVTLTIHLNILAGLVGSIPSAMVIFIIKRLEQLTTKPETVIEIARACNFNVALICSCRQQPYVLRSPRRRLAVEVQLQNQLENAYNTSLTLHYSKNLHFSSLSIRVPT